MITDLILRAYGERDLDRQDVTILLQDFSFTDPAEIFAGLRGGTIAPVGSGMASMNMGMVRSGDASIPAMDHSQMGMTQPMAGMDHSQMDHGEMDHETMDHGEMDDGEVDDETMDHSQMEHPQ